MIYLIIGPLGFFLIFRIAIPITWCFVYLMSDERLKHFDIVLFHLIFLLCEGLLTLNLMFFTSKYAQKFRKLRNLEIYKNQKNKEANTFSIFAILGIVFLLLINYKNLPVFIEGGSDAIVILGEIEKTKTWFTYGIIEIFSQILLFAIIYTLDKRKKYIYGFFFFFSKIVTGKKAALIGAASQLIFLYYILEKRRPDFPLLKITFVLVLSILFIVVQYARTARLEINYIDYFSILDIFLKVVYSSSTVYLEQFIVMDGLSYAENYSKSLGIGGALLYFLNPFIKFLLGIGIDKSIGPYLMQQFYGEIVIPNGVNPTLFFEYIFVFGSMEYIFFAFLNLFLIFVLARYFIKKVIQNFNTSILVTITYFGMFVSCFNFLADTLNTIRTLPFVLTPMFIFYFCKFLFVCGRTLKVIKK